jgi:hypothetical protein
MVLTVSIRGVEKEASMCVWTWAETKTTKSTREGRRSITEKGEKMEKEVRTDGPSMGDKGDEQVWRRSGRERRERLRSKLKGEGSDTKMF